MESAPPGHASHPCGPWSREASDHARARTAKVVPIFFRAGALSVSMGVDTQRITRLVEQLLNEEEPPVSLRALTQLRGQLGELERAQVARALAAGHSFTAISAPLSISRQA